MERSEQRLTWALLSELLTKLRDNAIFWVPFTLFLVGLVARLWASNSVPVFGDEISSITEGKLLTNLHSLAYFLPLSLWLKVSDDANWLRLLSIIPGALAVPVTWLWIRNWRGPTIATITATLLIVSSIAVEYAREIRFYGIYLLSSALFLLAYSRISRNGKLEGKPFDWIFLVLSAILVLLSHLVAPLLIGLVIIHAIVNNFERLPRTIKRLILLGVVAAVIALIYLVLNPGVLRGVYQAVRIITASPTNLNYSGGRGWSVVTIAKLIIWYYSFSFGQFIYPLDLAVTAPALLLTTIFLAAGILRLVRSERKDALWLIVFIVGGAVVGLYLVFDALWPAGSRDSAAPKYIIFALPLFLWLIAEGTQMPSQKLFRQLCVAAMVIVQVIGLVALYRADWSDGYKAMRVGEPVTAIAQEASRASTIVLADGRSSGVLSYYLRGTGIPVRDAWPENLNNKLTSNQIVFSAADDRKEIRCQLQQTLNRLANAREVYHWVNYPFFVYIFDRVTPITTDAGFALPRSLYGLEFADLNLPQQVTWEGKAYTIGGMFSLPTCDNELTLQVENLRTDSTDRTKAFLLFSNVLQASAYENGTVLGRLSATATDGTQFSFDIRKGYETQDWNSLCVNVCRQVLTWHKRVALVGASAYPGAYSDFQAKVWGATLNLPQPVILKSIALTTFKPDVSLNIWGLFPLAEPPG